MSGDAIWGTIPGKLSLISPVTPSALLCPQPSLLPSGGTTPSVMKLVGVSVPRTEL